MATTPNPTPAANANRIDVSPGVHLAVTVRGRTETHAWTDETAADVLGAILDMATAREVALAAHGVRGIDEIDPDQRPEVITVVVRPGRLPAGVEGHLQRLRPRSQALGLLFAVSDAAPA